MQEKLLSVPLKKIARFAGLSYLLFIICTVVADSLSMFAMTENSDAFDKIIENSSSFTFGLVANLFSAFFFLLAAWLLYVLLKTVNEKYALLLFVLNAAGGVIQCVSVLFLFGTVKLLSGDEYLDVISSEALEAQAMLFINIFQDGLMIAQMFFGTWLLPLGYLVYKSDIMPKWLGMILIADGFAILGWFFQYFLFPDFEVVSYVFTFISAIAEFLLTFWLLAKGVHEKK